MTAHQLPPRPIHYYFNSRKFDTTFGRKHADNGVGVDNDYNFVCEAGDAPESLPIGLIVILSIIGLAFVCCCCYCGRTSMAVCMQGVLDMLEHYDVRRRCYRCMSCPCLRGQAKAPATPLPMHAPEAILVPPPSYWRCKDTLGAFREVVSDNPMVREVASIVNNTASSKKTVDRKGEVPKSFEIVSAQRCEDSILWSRYTKQRGAIKERLIGGAKTRINAKTTTHLSEEMKQSLDPAVNEVFLFHGTDMEAVENICSAGFRIDFAGKAIGTTFGKGAYFAECATKSDEYAQPKPVKVGLLEETHRAMLLCRVCLGEAFRIEDFDSKAERHVLGSTEYDSLLGDREAKVGTYREFIVYNESQVYPEYVIIYKAIEQHPETMV